MEVKKTVPGLSPIEHLKIASGSTPLTFSHTYTPTGAPFFPATAFGSGGAVPPGWPGSYFYRYAVEKRLTSAQKVAICDAICTLIALG